MKIVIVGGSGLIGRQLAARLREAGHDPAIASPSHGVDAVSGRGLDAVMQGAEAVVDVSNAPSFEARAVLEFFETSTRRLLAAGAAAGVRHHLALSVVGCDRLPDNAYLRAKLAQERLIEAGGLPCTILRATQFFEFLPTVAEAGTVDGVVHAPAARMQPVAAADVAAALAELLAEGPQDAVLELGGPQAFAIEDLLRRVLVARGDGRRVVTDREAAYFGGRLEPDSLTPGAGARLGRTALADWLRA